MSLPANPLTSCLPPQFNRHVLPILLLLLCVSVWLYLHLCVRPIPSLCRLPVWLSFTSPVTLVCLLPCALTLLLLSLLLHYNSSHEATEQVQVTEWHLSPPCLLNMDHLNVFN